MKNKLIATVLLVCTIYTCQASAELNESNSATSIVPKLESMTNQLVTLRLSSGMDISGRLMEIDSGILRLKAITGKEYYDAYILVDNVEAIIFRRES